ncbi:MAG: hypothetical protein AB7D07_13005 [Desulfovibrionaceae bacterium]|jgi:hypothetical protein
MRKLLPLLTLLALAAVGCAKQPCVTVPIKFQEFDNYEPYCPELVCPLCGFEFLGDVPSIVERNLP